MASSSCVLTETHRLAAPDQLITELTRGRDIADRLRFMLRQTSFDTSPDSVFPAQITLVNQLLDTFTHSLTMLRDGADSDEVSQAPSAAKSEDSGDSCKTPPPPKDRRGCYKRKRNSETTIKETSNLFEDGHAWRKYGQKVILNAKHPRNYFRCTHKFDQGCQASKQVQKIEDNPPLYRTTYNGHHTCKNLFKSAHHIITDSPAPDSSVIWNFNTDVLADPAPEIKRENAEDKVGLVKASSHSDYYMSPELTGFDASHLTAFSSGSDRGDVMSSDVYSCTASTHHSMDDMDAIVGSIEDFFEFETLS